MTKALSPDLRAWVEAEMGSAVVVAEPIGRGASRRIWGIALESGEEVVVREDTGDGPVAGTPLTLSREADAYRALATTDLPVPPLRAVHRDGTALLIERAAGDDQLKGVADAELRSVAEDYGRCLGRLHLLDPGTLALGSITPRPGAVPTADDLHLWRAIDAARIDGASSPAARVALRHLAGAVPASTREALCHGDAGPGNFLHAGGRVTALLDWEFAHVGDPHDDLAWVAVRNQVLGHPFPVAIAYAAWSDTTSSAIDLPRLEWFRALVLTRMLIIVRRRHRLGRRGRPQRAGAGRAPPVPLGRGVRGVAPGRQLGPRRRRPRAGRPRHLEGFARGRPPRRPRLPRRPRSPAVTRPLTDADDRHHEVGDPHPMWTETTWWGFLVPDRALGGMIYTLFRPNLGVATPARGGVGRRGHRALARSLPPQPVAPTVPEYGPRRHRGRRAAAAVSRAVAVLRPHLRRW